MGERYIGAELNELSHLLRRKMSGPERASSMTILQSRVLCYLLQSEGQGDRFQRDVETHFHIRRSTATGMLQLMERKGFLRREAVSYDARLKRLVLTEKARELDESARQRIEWMENLMRRGINTGELEVWFGVCERIRTNLEQYQCGSDGNTKEGIV